MKSGFVTAIVLSAVVLVAQPPLSAEIALVQSTGTAEVGTTFDSPFTLGVEGCGLSGNPDAGVFGKGMHATSSLIAGPGKPHGGKFPSLMSGKLGVYHLFGDAAVSGANVASGSYILHVCGEHYPGRLGIGAGCGSTTGHDGRGRLVQPASSTTYQLTELSWMPAGGVAAVQGNIQRIEPTAGHLGAFRGTFSLSPGPGCVLAPKPAESGAKRDMVFSLVLYGGRM